MNAVAQHVAIRQGVVMAPTSKQNFIIHEDYIR